MAVGEGTVLFDGGFVPRIGEAGRCEDRPVR